MGLTERLRDRVQPLLDPGEQVQEVFAARSGPNQNLILVPLVWFLVPYISKYWIVAATNKSIVVFSAGRNGKPKGDPVRFPRDTRIGPLKSAPLWGNLTISIESKPLQVHRARVKDVERADAAA